MDQDYLYSLSKTVDSDAIRRAGVDLVIIGNGSPGMIRSYRRKSRFYFVLYFRSINSLRNLENSIHDLYGPN